MSDYPVTPAIRVLREKKIDFTPHLYAYEEKGGTRVSAQALQVPEHQVIKTLVMMTDERKVLLVLMHGDKEVSTKELARTLGVKRIEPCDEQTAQRQTGYQFGGTSPFGTRNPLPVYAEETIFELPRIYINGGKRGFLVGILPADVDRAVAATKVRVATKPENRTLGT
jgi:Cys-tRNA(Pro) deacylase